MKNTSNISLIGQLLSGIILAAFIVAQSVEVSPDKRDEQEQSDRQEDSAAHSVAQAEVAIPHSSTEINLTFSSYLLDELIFQETDDKENDASELALQSLQKVGKVLFTRIIAPNAP